MLNYKESTIPFKNLEFLDFFDNVKENLADYFKIANSESSFELLSDSDFRQIIEDISEAINQGNWSDLESLLLVLIDQFSIQNQIVQYRCKIFQKLPICDYFLQQVDCHSLCSEKLAPLILQLFINILYVEDDKHEFSILNFDRLRGPEIIMHLKKTMPKYLPLIFIYAFNIYYECSNYIVYETTELLDYTLCYTNDPNSYYLAPLAMINLLRNEEIGKDELPDNFLKNLISIAKNTRTCISIFSMWCLYFYFKRSYMNAKDAIKKKLLKLLQSKILTINSLTEAKIALFIFSYCYLVNDENKKLKCIQNTPIDEIIQLMMSDEKELSALSIVLCNNYIISRPSSLIYFLRKGGFDMVCEIAKNGPLNCKIQAGIIIITILKISASEDQEKLYSPEVLSLLCDLWQINDHELNLCIINFILQTLRCYKWVIEFLISENFENELYYLQENARDEILTYSIKQLIRIIKYNKEEKKQ